MTGCANSIDGKDLVYGNIWMFHCHEMIVFLKDC